MDNYDAEYQILSRITSLQTLHSCKAVCNSWYQIINHVSFMPSYCRNTGNMYGYNLQARKNEQYSKSFLSINQDDEYNNSFMPSYTDLKFDDNGVVVSSSETDLKFDDDEVKIVASSMEGIMCCVKAFPNGNNGTLRDQLFVCKPATGQWRKIPTTISCRGIVGLFILSNNPLRYKILRIRGHCSKYWHEIFDSKTWKWSEMVKISLPSCKRFNEPQGIQAGRYLYFLMDTLVLAFHGDYENIYYFRLPRSLYSRVDQNAQYSTISPIFQMKATEYQGNLGLICTTLSGFTSMQLWVLEEQNPRKWKKIKEVDMRFLRPVLYPIGFYSADILVLRQHNGPLILCNLLDFTYKEVNLDCFDYIPETFPFRSDREPVDLNYDDDHIGVNYLDCFVSVVGKIGIALFIIVFVTVGLCLLVMVSII